ncbi:uncharacterized protein N7496_012094 [Penicillium cataractarum]|uniref:DUF2293 domain-containing protein n=1 Tax=Penicillium cataractarum TaxID=2100454 RepID=A0A9W9UYM9_9EURO|nr:uncharacterized protein N7496_012094 [Penicillium cataractarum]KAJ5359681.1 hypothetical protein N7496_012094 [Penicillium cataractarum]
MAYLAPCKVCVRRLHKKVAHRRPGSVRKPKARSLATASQRDEKCPEQLEGGVYERAPMPEGYSFVPKGDIFITLKCRMKTWESKQIVYNVYNGLTQIPVGIRVPSGIYAEVLAKSKETERPRAFAANPRYTNSQDPARTLLRRHFPMMPGHILDSIVEYAFQEGSGRVGCDETLSDSEKAQLAVEAHIRHHHTPYEAMLESGLDRELAHRRVRETVQRIRKAWEGTD